MAEGGHIDSLVTAKSHMQGSQPFPDPVAILWVARQAILALYVGSAGQFDNNHRQPCEPKIKHLQGLSVVVRHVQCSTHSHSMLHLLSTALEAWQHVLSCCLVADS